MFFVLFFFWGGGFYEQPVCNLWNALDVRNSIYHFLQKMVLLVKLVFWQWYEATLYDKTLQSTMG